MNLSAVSVTVAPRPPNPKNVEQAARDFESMLIEQMLKTARASGIGDWMGSAEDGSGSALSEMAEQQFAQLLAGSGGFGLAKLVVGGMKDKP